MWPRRALFPDCPGSDTASKLPFRDAESKKPAKDGDCLICFKCGGLGHKSPDCPSKKTYEVGKNAKKACAASSHASSPDAKRSPAPQNQIDAQPVNDLGPPWIPYFAFSAVPRFTIPPVSHRSRSLQSQQPPLVQPPVLVPSGLVWDKTTKEYVDSSSSYYYETRHPSVFNNFDVLAPGFV